MKAKIYDLVDWVEYITKSDHVELSVFDGTNTTPKVISIKEMHCIVDHPETKSADGSFAHGPPKIKITLTPDL